MDDLPAVTDLIPHRGRWLLIRNLVSADLERGVIEADGAFDAAFADGHFPGQPIVPGVALLEGLAQTMGCLAQLSAKAGIGAGEAEGGTPYLAAFDKVRFRAPVIPPAEVRFKVVVKEQRMGLTSASGEVRCGGKRVVTARLTGITVPAGALPTDLPVPADADR